MGKMDKIQIGDFVTPVIHTDHYRNTVWEVVELTPDPFSNSAMATCRCVSQDPFIDRPAFSNILLPVDLLDRLKLHEIEELANIYSDLYNELTELVNKKKVTRTSLNQLEDETKLSDTYTFSATLDYETTFNSRSLSESDLAQIESNVTVYVNPTEKTINVMSMNTMPLDKIYFYVYRLTEYLNYKNILCNGNVNFYPVHNPIVIKDNKVSEP